VASHFNFLCCICVRHNSLYSLIENNSSSINSKKDEKVSHWLNINITKITGPTNYIIVTDFLSIDHEVLDHRWKWEPEHPTKLRTEFIRSILLGSSKSVIFEFRHSFHLVEITIRIIIICIFALHTFFWSSTLRHFFFLFVSFLLNLFFLLLDFTLFLIMFLLLFLALLLLFFSVLQLFIFLLFVLLFSCHFLFVYSCYFFTLISFLIFLLFLFMFFWIFFL